MFRFIDLRINELDDKFYAAKTFDKKILTPGNADVIIAKDAKNG